MEMNEILTNDEVIEKVEEIATSGPSGGLIMAVIFGAGLLGGIFADRYLVAPIMSKIKLRKKQEQATIHVMANDVEIVDEEIIE